MDCVLWEVPKHVRKVMWRTDKLVKGEKCAEGFASGRILDISVGKCCLMSTKKIKVVLCS